MNITEEKSCKRPNNDGKVTTSRVGSGTVNRWHTDEALGI